jgi:hypothetical protein
MFAPKAFSASAQSFCEALIKKLPSAISSSLSVGRRRGPGAGGGNEELFFHLNNPQLVNFSFFSRS